MNPTFQAADGGAGVTVVDPIQNKQYPFETTGPVVLRESDPNGFYFPVDSATEFTTARLLLPYVVPTIIREPTGAMLLETEHFASESLPDGDYLLEVMAPIRIYVRARSGVTITSSDERLIFDFGEPTTVRLGARSHHERPAATVETTADLLDLARAVSTFGSALKTLRCERSLPTFRGHPPRVELGESLRIPSGLEPPETGVTLVVPPERTAVYAASSLAYYLGATVVIGAKPRIETDRGLEYELGRSGVAFERSVERVLRHVFFLDCLTRTEGFYQIDLHERRQVDDRLDVPFETLYDEPLTEQLSTYLEIPFDAVADVAPTWKLITHVTDEPENAAALPSLVNELSLVRAASATTRAQATRSRVSPGVDAFTRSPSRSDRSGQLGRSSEAFVSPPIVDAYEQAWLGEGVPIGANKLLHAAFENELERSPSTDGIEITVVCNDDQMAREVDGRLYGDREELPFAVADYRNLSTAELRALFAEDIDFFHYVGHVENDAFVCHDGHLDASELTDVGVDTFLINGCQSYEIGSQLIRSGSVGGIVTLSDIGNPDAVAVGRLIAQLLNTGFTLRSAVNIARTHRLVGNQYIVIGQGGSAVAQSGGGVPNHCRIEPTDAGEYLLYLRLHHCSQAEMGALSIPYIDEVDQFFLVGGELPTFELSGDVLSRFLRLEQIPVECEGELCWSTDERFADL